MSGGSSAGTNYDAYGRPVIEDLGGQRVEHRGYNQLGNVVWSATYGLCAADGSNCTRQVPYSRPVFGQTRVDAAVEYDYELSGRLERVRQWHFDVQGLPWATVWPLPADPGNRSRQAVIEHNNGTRSIAAFDGAGRVITSLDPAAGHDVIQRYRDGGRTVLRGTVAPAPTGAVGKRVTLTPWGAPLTTALLEGTGDLTTRTVREQDSLQYDQYRRVRLATAASGATDVPVFDAFGRLRQRTLAMGGGLARGADPGLGRQRPTRLCDQ